MNIFKKVLAIFMFFCLSCNSLVICMGGLQFGGPQVNVGAGVNVPNVPPNNGQGDLIMRRAIIGALAVFVAKVVTVVGLDYFLNKNKYYHENIDPTIKRWSLFLGNGHLLSWAIVAPFILLLPFAVRPPAGL